MSYPVSDPYIPDYADQEKDRLATMTTPLDDAKLAQSEEELNDEADYFWRTIRQSQTALRTIYKDMKRDADRLSLVLRENERLRKFAEDAALFSVDPNTVSDARAALDPIKPDEK